jgi:hypothetical protein
MTAAAEQLGLAITAAPDSPDEGDEQALLLEHLVAACRAVARELTYEACAKSLDAIWGERGRPVSASVLRAGLSGTERNYFRVEWAFWFARRSETVAEILLEVAGRARPKKKPEDELRDLKALIREELPKRATALIRKAELP